MERYDYLKTIKEDVREAIDCDFRSRFKEFETMEDLEEELNEVLFSEDGVTGNASGSYTFYAWTAEENLTHNLDLAEEACSSFGINLGEAVKKGAEYIDVTIRCYLLSDAISEVLKEYEGEFNDTHGGEEACR